MSEASSDDANKPMEKPNKFLSKSLENLSVITHDSDETSTPPKNLSDMPVDVVGLIIERSDYKRQLKLRKVSKSLRALVDRQIPACKKIEVEFGDDYVNVVFNNYCVSYTDYIVEHGDDDDRLINVVRDDYKKAAFDDLASTLKNPKLQLEEFNTCEDGEIEKKDIKEYYNEIQRVLKSLNHQLFVKKVDLHVLSPSNLLSILPYLKPGFLKNISIWLDDETAENNWRIDSSGMDQVGLLEQWKQAKELELVDCFDRFPLEYATHFKRFRISEKRIDGDMFIRIKDFLSELHHFEQCTLSFYGYRSDPRSIYELLGEPVSSNATEEVFHHAIPDSDYYFELEKAKNFRVVEIEIKMRKGNR